jgi:hypothetical protein
MQSTSFEQVDSSSILSVSSTDEMSDSSDVQSKSWRIKQRIIYGFIDAGDSDDVEAVDVDAVGTSLIVLINKLYSAINGKTGNELKLSVGLK